MHKELIAILKTVAEKINKELPESFHNKYYSKMEYSGINKILNKDVNLLKSTLSIEIALSHFVVYKLSKILNYQDYKYLIKKLDREEYFCWYQIDNDIKLAFDKISYDDFESLSVLLRDHDTLLEKSIKKEVGQFYTPINIVNQMICGIFEDYKSFDESDKIVDPAVGTGVLIVEFIKRIIDDNKNIDILSFIDNNIYAFDVNPFAIIATKINILINLCSQVEMDMIHSYINSNKFLFTNIVIENSITSTRKEQYSIIISNPPYFKLDNKMLSNVCDYDTIIYGQPNIYSLFVYWGLNHIKEDGIMCYIIPQSIKSGLYFKKLRNELSKYVISSITCIDSRQRIFDRAEQAVLILNVKKKKRTNDKTRIQFLNSGDNHKTTFKINSRKVLLDKARNSMFVINRSLLEYEILDKIYKNSYNLNSDESNYKFSNGLFVWNQHKDLLSDEESYPFVIFGGNIQPNNFKDDILWNNDDKKSHAKPDPKTKGYLHQGKKLLVQRTTNYEKDVRIKCCLITDDFLNRHNYYFLENHVNYLKEKKNNPIEIDTLYYFLGVLNSTVFNKLFVSFSGNTQVSANELNLIPFPYDNGAISTYMQNCEKNDDFKQNELDELVCESYGITKEEFDVLC